MRTFVTRSCLGPWCYICAEVLLVYIGSRLGVAFGPRKGVYSVNQENELHINKSSLSLRNAITQTNLFGYLFCSLHNLWLRRITQLTNLGKRLAATAKGKKGIKVATAKGNNDPKQPHTHTACVSICTLGDISTSSCHTDVKCSRQCFCKWKGKWVPILENLPMHCSPCWSEGFPNPH